MVLLLNTVSNVDESLGNCTGVPTKTDGAETQAANFTVTVGRGSLEANRVVVLGHS